MKVINRSVFSFDEVTQPGEWTGGSPSRRRSSPESPFEASDAPDVVQTRVVVADRDPSFARELERALKAVGYDVYRALDGLDILTSISPFILGEQEAPQPHIIVAEALLPGVTGLSILAGLRAGVWRPGVILLSSKADRTSQAEASWLGATAVLEKPFPLEQLVEAVTRTQGAWTRVD